jgi:hypothetical protein
LNVNVGRSPEFILVRRGSAALPSALPSRPA